MSEAPALALHRSLVVLFGVSVIVFLMIRLIPGDAVAIMLGANTEITPERVAELKRAHRSRPSDGGAILQSGLGRPCGEISAPRFGRPPCREPRSWSIFGRRSNSPPSLVIGAGLAVPLGCLMAQTRGAAPTW